MRGEDNFEKIREQQPFIEKYFERFTLFTVPNEISEISSSEFRKKIHNKDKSASQLVTDEVWRIFSENGGL
ncbi:MAG: hypothetical protein IIY78_03910 [Clostridia bacterium]|nr:hypothetical protein [Clostridia bacterium]